MGSMAVTGTNTVGAGQDYVSALKKAVKDYRDTMLTGLTEDEKKQIQAKLEAYREKCVKAGMSPKEIQAAMDAYHKELLKEYGAKFDTEFEKAHDSLVEGAGESKAPGTGTPEKSDIITETVTEPDGTVYLIITSPNGINMKIKIGSNEDGQEEVSAESQKGKDLAGAMGFYEKNVDTFFQEESKMSVTS